jgi:hypothetical protein
VIRRAFNVLAALSLVLSLVLLSMACISFFHPAGIELVVRSCSARLDVWHGSARVWVEYDEERRRPSGIRLARELSSEIPRGRSAQSLWTWPAPQNIQSSPTTRGYSDKTGWRATPWVRDIRLAGFRLFLDAKRRIPQYDDDPPVPALKTCLVYAPVWFVTGACVVDIAAIVLLTLHRRRWRRRSTGTCARCGYDLRATPTRCPECGMIPAGHAAQSAK